MPCYLPACPHQVSERAGTGRRHCSADPSPISWALLLPTCHCCLLSEQGGSSYGRKERALLSLPSCNGSSLLELVCCSAQAPRERSHHSGLVDGSSWPFSGDEDCKIPSTSAMYLRFGSLPATALRLQEKGAIMEA